MLFLMFWNESKRTSMNLLDMSKVHCGISYEVVTNKFDLILVI